jgi:uncharacterized protein with PQ loop repeat
MATHPESVVTLANAFGAATVFVAAGFTLPQLLQLCRGNCAGVSIAAVTNTAISFVAWTVYAVWVGDGWLLASSLVGLPGTVTTAVIAVRRGGEEQEGFRLPLAWALTLVVATAGQRTGMLPVISLVVGTSIVWTAVPALVVAWRSRDVSGIAAGSWWVQVGEGLLYLGYGLTQGQQAATTYAVACLLGSSGMLTRLAVANPSVAQLIGPRAPARRARARQPWVMPRLLYPAC